MAVSSLPFTSRADDAGAQQKINSVTTGVLITPPASADNAAGEDTNAVPLKDLMSTNNVVTNTVHTILVKLSPTLWVGRYEVTQREYRELTHANPSAFRGDDHPVDSVSWNDAMDFCHRLTVKEQDQLPAGFSYSLPTEAQWQTLVGNADLKDAVMKFTSDRSSTASVGSLGPNNLGLYDMRGNVMEWCLDAHDPSYHILRGGAWDTSAEPSTRIEFRNYVQNPGEKKNDYGFRVLLEAGQ